LALQKQIHVYSLDTAFFYNENEVKIQKNMNKLYIHRNKLKKILKKSNDDIKFKKISLHISKTNKRLVKLKEKICLEFTKNNKLRILNSEKITSRNIVSIFESTLTRTIKIPVNTLTKDIIIVQTYFFDIIKDIILNGFLLDGEKYICFTASAGQIRTKKTVFIKQSTLNKHTDSLMCGLTRNIINELGGININKYLAYLALSNSATDVWQDFNISKSIVVDDMETKVKGIVDFIDDVTYKITRKKMNVDITHTDGCGMMLPSVNNKSFMVRLPWIKGLLVPFDFRKFIIQNNTDSKIKDIYGKEWDILKDDIEIIFTKSQFKMYKYYKSWKNYCSNFIKHECQAGKCNEEGSFTNDAKINYQMLQTLTDMTDEELREIASMTIDNIRNINTDKRTMFRVLGVTRNNTNKNYIQQAIEIYPNILRDTYSKDILRQTKKSIVKHGRSGRLDIKGKYAFICPDLYAFCEYLFMKNKNPNGLLKDGEVYCNIYRDEPKLDCLRSPHLYREHAVRNNVIDSIKDEWYVTGGLYTSCHDLISKILQFDNDGDCSLVIADRTLISVAERNMKNIVPLFYNMAKAGGWIINNSIIFEGLKTAYTGGNIGAISNDITKIWNSGNVDLNIIKLLCMENNFTIDYAKTLYKPERPKEIKKLITKHTNVRVPHFFMYAKDKNKHSVEKINDSVVNRLEKLIKNEGIKFNVSNVGKFDYQILSNMKNVNLDIEIIELYEYLDLKKFSMMNNKKDIENYAFVYQDIRNKILELNPDIYYVVAVLVEYLYKVKNMKNKTTLWECFGDIIVNNIKNNIRKRYLYCDSCGILEERMVNNQKYCVKCQKENDKEKRRKWWKKSHTRPSEKT